MSKHQTMTTLILYITILPMANLVGLFDWPTIFKKLGLHKYVVGTYCEK